MYVSKSSLGGAVEAFAISHKGCNNEWSGMLFLHSHLETTLSVIFSCSAKDFWVILIVYIKKWRIYRMYICPYHRNWRWKKENSESNMIQRYVLVKTVCRYATIGVAGLRTI